MERFKSKLEETKQHRWRTRDSIDPILLYCHYIIEQSADQVAEKEITAFLQDFDKDRNEVLEALELRDLSDSASCILSRHSKFLAIVTHLSRLGLKLKLDTFKGLFQNEQADVRLELDYIVSNAIVRSRSRALLSHPDGRYQLTPSLTKIVDPHDNTLRPLLASLERVSSDRFLVYYIGPRAIFTKYYQIRGAVDNWFYDTYPIAAIWELKMDRWYTLSLSLALMCLIVVPLACCGITKALLANGNVHRD